ncbi:MAG: DNA polymerase III subunit delta' [Myxococcota bacterium]
MSSQAIRGQATAIETLRRALRSGHVHHAYRFEGIAGVGKERTALALAQALLYPELAEVAFSGSAGERGRRVTTFTEGPPSVPIHPDVTLVARGLYPPETIGGKREAQEISVEQVRRVVLSRVAYAPHEAQAQVFIIRDADQLSISAANALLKTLEEPRAGTHFILLTSQPERLLDTIRSRTLPVRFGPLSEEVLREILVAQGVAPAEAAAAAALAGGSAEVALEASARPDSPERAAFVDAVIAAMKGPGTAAGVILGEGTRRERADVVLDLEALAASVVGRARGAVARGDDTRAEGWARRHQLVLDAIDAVQRNGAVNVVVASLVASLQRGDQRRPGEKPPVVVTRR